MRHNLGEYYTPDWLAERLLTQVDNDFFDRDASASKMESALRPKLRQLRWLDPACGSGTFLILTIRRYVELGRALAVDDAELLDLITRNVVGFDLNPLAVMTARVNYLLAIADLLQYRKGEVAIPVYMADSIATPAAGEDLFTSGTYQVKTPVGTFALPQKVFEHDLDGFCELLDASVRAELGAEAFCKRVAQELGLALDDDALELVVRLYEQLLDYHCKGLNGLWARLIRNNFAPLTSGEFDYVVGNPPWVNWEHLPDGYREETRGLWLRYRLAGSFTGGRPRLGAVKVDISALMTYVAMDAYLKPGGRLGFVITQAVFKTAEAGRGFRRFAIPAAKGPDTPLRVTHVDDMVELQPFEGASNRTTVAVFDKGRATSYPVPYTLWRKKRGLPRGQGLTYDHTLGEARAITVRRHLVAEPVSRDDPTSPWLTVPRAALKGLSNVRGASPYTAHAGVCTWANGVYFLDVLMERPDGLLVVANLTEGTRLEVDAVREALEPDLVYPLLRGRDVTRWRAEASAFILVPHDPATPNRAYPQESLQRDLPRTYGYLRRFEAALRGRSGYRQILSRRESEFYGLMDIDHYTFAPWKVIWREMADGLTCAVVGMRQGKSAVPDHKLMLVPADSEAEAHYIAAALNSSTARLVCLGYTIGTQMDTHIAESIRVPQFDPADSVHVSLSELSREAHEAAAAQDTEALVDLERQVDQRAAELWGLSGADLSAVGKALEVMS